ncbi:MAG: hypothetical protein RR766_09475, partial [Longicatena sp.]
THLPMQKVSNVYYKDSFIGIAEDGDSTAMQRLMNQALELHDKKEKEKEKIEEQELVFTYARDTQTKVLHEEVNKSFTEPAPLDMKELGEQIATLQNTPKEPISIPKQTFTKEIVQEDENKYQGEQAATLLKEVVQTQPLIYEKKETVNEVKALNPSLPQLRVIGQFHTCYILAEGEKGLYIIDQHAAQERYHYEIIRNKIMNGNIDSQPLLLPVTIESSVSAIAQIQDLNALLEQLGIHLEAFGDTTFICRSLPIWMKDVEEAAFIIDMIDIWEKDKEISLDKLRKHAIATMACHSSIRFNRTLTLD